MLGPNDPMTLWMDAHRNSDLGSFPSGLSFVDPPVGLEMWPTIAWRGHMFLIRNSNGFSSWNCERVRLCKIMSNDDFFLELLCCSNDPICGILSLPCHIVSLLHSVNSIFEIAQTPSPLLIPVSWSHFVASKMLEGHLGKLSKIIFQYTVHTWILQVSEIWAP